MQLSPTAIRVLKSSFNADVADIDGIEALSGHLHHFYVASDEAHEGTKAFLEKRPPDYSKWR